MNAQEKKFIRSIIRQVHPDLFVLHPVERQKNSESLKVGPSREPDAGRPRAPRIDHAVAACRRPSMHSSRV